MVALARSDHEVLDGGYIGSTRRPAHGGREGRGSEQGAPAEAVREMGPQKPDSGHEPTRSFDLDHHETVEELRALPDEEIERRHDMIMRSVATLP
jgi:hypothetical protein